MHSEAQMPRVGQVVAVVDAQLGSGLLRCLGPGCGGRLVRWGFGGERDVVGLGGGTGRGRPRRGAVWGGGGRGGGGGGGGGGWGGEREVVGWGGGTGRVRPRRALCAGCGVSRVL